MFVVGIYLLVAIRRASVDRGMRLKSIERRRGKRPRLKNELKVENRQLRHRRVNEAEAEEV